MSTSSFLYNLGFQDGLNNRYIDSRYADKQEYLAGYEQGIEQRKLNVKRLILSLKGK